jgi:D-glycero-beta-D-manno-heptose 1-phosphate adenylyltransferase
MSPTMNLSPTMNHIQSKVFEHHDVPGFQEKLHGWRKAGTRLVFTNGCFDLLHPGHIDYLSRAADLGDVLVVGLNTDVSVRRLKGDDRPVNDQHARAILLAALGFVDAVVYFDEDTPLSLVSAIQPDVLVKGGDYREEEIIGSEIVKAKNGKVVAIEFLKGYSTSAIIQKIRK